MQDPKSENNKVIDKNQHNSVENNGESHTQKSKSFSSNDYKKDNVDTYLKIADDNTNDILEFDLVYVREKNKSNQFLEVKITFYDDYQQPQEITKLIDSKEQFDKIKSFFSNLEWDVSIK